MFLQLCRSHVKETDTVQRVVELKAPDKEDEQEAAKKTREEKRNGPHIPTTSRDQAVLHKPAKKDNRSVHNYHRII